MHIYLYIHIYPLTAQLDKKCPIGDAGELSIAKANPTDHILQQHQWLCILHSITLLLLQDIILILNLN
jgi:hypothetical protein